MRIGIQTWGTEGDVRPFFALGAGLAARGHAVTLAYTNIEGRDYSPLAQACGFEARDVAGDWFRARPDEVASVAREIFHMSDPLAQIRCVLTRFFEPLVAPMFEASRRLARESDFLVGYFLHHPLATAALEAGVPYATVLTAPMLPSRTYAPPGFPALGPLMNRMGWWLAVRVAERMLRPQVNALRAQTQVPRVRRLFGDGFASSKVVLASVSPTLVPQPPDWPANAHVVGFLDLPERARAWAPSDELARFLEGPPPVFMTFGSMLSLDPAITAESIDLMAKTAQCAGVRTIIQVPDAHVSQVPVSEKVFAVGRAPHNELFPRSACVVHHGGAGTTQAAMLAGVPSVIVPFAADQIGWGATLRRLGVAPRHLLRRKATPEALAARIREVLAQPEMRPRAQALGARMRAEDGVATAVRLIEEAAGAPRGS